MQRSESCNAGGCSVWNEVELELSISHYARKGCLHNEMVHIWRNSSEALAQLLGADSQHLESHMRRQGCQNLHTGTKLSSSSSCNISVKTLHNA